jgi:Signal recognition particle GTPase
METPDRTPSTRRRFFNQSFPLTGLVVTKLDGTARGGSVLSITSSLQIPIRWVGMGEQIDQLVEFNKREYIDGLFENALEESK